MHYYQHHIGDFIKATARLSDTQAMGYLRLLWMYYDSEKPLKPEVKVLAFQIGASVEETEMLLESFFWLAENGWHHTRCDKEIAEYREFLNKKSNAGKASAERRKNKSSTGDEQMLNTSLTTEQLTTNHKPITTNHKPIVEKSQRGSRLANDWVLPDEWEYWANKERPDLDAKQVFDQFRDYWCAKAGKDAIKLDWQATWRNWVRNQKTVKPNFADIVRLTVPSKNEPDPALEKIKADEKKAAPMPDHIRQAMQALRSKA
jgi:uncharacterized protein YdaU (DUF1376 family)